MIVKIGSTSSPKNSITKNFNIIYTLDGRLINQSSIIEPELIVECDSEIITANYLIIEDFDRRYFITDIVSIRNGLWHIKTHVDVLSSFSSQILSNVAIVDRIEEKETPYLADGRYTFDSNNDYYVKKFGSGLSKKLHHILVVAGQN